MAGVLWYLRTLDVGPQIVRQRFFIIYLAAWCCLVVLALTTLAQWLIVAVDKARKRNSKWPRRLLTLTF